MLLFTVCDQRIKRREREKKTNHRTEIRLWYVHQSIGFNASKSKSTDRKIKRDCHFKRGTFSVTKANNSSQETECVVLLLQFFFQCYENVAFFKNSLLPNILRNPFHLVKSIDSFEKFAHKKISFFRGFSDHLELSVIEISNSKWEQKSVKCSLTFEFTLSISISIWSVILSVQKLGVYIEVVVLVPHA